MNPLLDSVEVQNFLNTFPSASRRRGKHYFADAAVLSVKCLVPGSEYGAVVRGSQDYEVMYDYDPEGRAWESTCTCESFERCKHAFAGMLALQTNALKLETAAAVAGNGNGHHAAKHNSNGNGNRNGQSKIVPMPRQPQPAATPIYDALRIALGRPLGSEEADYVRRIQASFNQVQQVGYSTFFTLSQICGLSLGDTWQRLDLWPSPPRDDLQFWLYCAWHFRRWEVPLPEFMLPVSDLGSIEPEMRRWDRGKQIQTWKTRLKTSDGKLKATSAALDLPAVSSFCS